MTFTPENLSKFLYKKINHHESYINDTQKITMKDNDKFGEGYHKGCRNAYENVIKEFDLQRIDGI